MTNEPAQTPSTTEPTSPALSTLNQQPSAEQPPLVKSTDKSPPKPKTVSPFFLYLVLGILFIVIGGPLYYAITRTLPFGLESQIPFLQTTPTSYEECAAIKGSVIQESFPEKCITKSGLSFVRQLTPEEQQRLNPPTPTPDHTANWQTYSNTRLNYQIKYPSDWTAKSTEPGPPAFDLVEDSKGIIIYPNIYNGISDARTYITIETDGPQNLAFSSYEGWLANVSTSKFYTVENSTLDTFADVPATVVSGSFSGYGFPANIKTIHFKSLDNNTYFSIAITDEKTSVNQNIINQILSTFRFIDKDQNITVTSPQPNSTISSPLTITGQADTTWFFEGDFSVTLLDQNRNETATSFVSETAPGSWLEGGTIDFSGTIEFSTTSPSGFLVFQKDNPSGLPENDASFEVSINFSN